MPLLLPTDTKPAGTPVPKTRAHSLIAEALHALAERNRAMGLTPRTGPTASGAPAARQPWDRQHGLPRGAATGGPY
jgi:hypothetical protein